MKLIQPLLITAAIAFFGCNKDKFTREPQVSIQSISPESVSSGALIRVNGKYTDKEGNLDSVLVVYKWYADAMVTFVDTLRYGFDHLGVPPKTREAEIDLVFEYNTFNTDFAKLSGLSQRDTTATLGMILKDKDSLRSNYAESPRIRIRKP